MSDVRNNPPASVVSEDELSRYHTLFDDITGNGTKIEYADRHALGELAVTLIEVDTLRASIRDDGEFMEVQGDRNKITKKNPSRDALEKIRPAMLRMMKEFRITPNSRAGTKVITPGGGGEEEEFDKV